VTASVRKRLAPLVAAIVAAGSIALLFGSTSEISAAQAAWPQLLNPEIAPRQIVRAKCVVIAGIKFCGGKHENKDKSDTTPSSEPKTETPKMNTCPLGTRPDGQCQCPPGEMNYADGTCAKPCGYGMAGKPPHCHCVTGATLQVTGPTTKGCLCPDGKPPEEVDGNYACQNLGRQ
jgi:hypothetical protein